MYKVRLLSDEPTGWLYPPVAHEFVTDNYTLHYQFDSLSVDGVRLRIAFLRRICDEMEIKANELGL